MPPVKTKAKRRPTKDVVVRETPPLEPWDKQTGEPAKAFEAFALYRDMGPTRSLTLLATRLHESYPTRFKNVESARGTVAQMSSAWRWQYRVEEFELAEDRARRERRRADVEAMERTHLTIASTLTTAAMARARGAVAGGNRPKTDPLPFDAIESWAELAAVAQKGAMLERLTLGLPTDLTKGLDSFPYSEVLSLVSDLTDYALEYLGEDAHEAYLRRVRERLSKMGGTR